MTLSKGNNTRNHCSYVNRENPPSVIGTKVSTVGRTVRTFRNAVDIEETRWKPFRRTLRPKQRKSLDRIFDYARTCADAGTMLATPRVTEVVLISTIIEMLQEIQDLRVKVAELEETEGT